jgi:MFS family permease
MSQDLGVSTQTYFWAFTLSLLVGGVLGPRVGRWIDEKGGSQILPLSNLFFISGLLILALAQDWVLLFLGWLVLGLAGATGFYDATFAAVVRLLGDKSKKTIAAITVFSGFSSTAAWPITALIEQNFNWRWALLFWVLVQLFIALPMNLTIPKVPARSVPIVTGPIKKLIKNRFKPDKLVAFFALIFTLEHFIINGVSTTLPIVFTELGISSASALFAATILGPSQAFARLGILAFSKKLSTMQLGIISTVVHPLGVLILFVFGEWGLIPFVILHGIGVGLNPFIRGALPLEFYGPDNYGQRLGNIMFTVRIFGAFSPIIFTALVLFDPALSLIVSASAGLIATAVLIALPRYKPKKAVSPEEAIAASDLTD